MRLLGTYKCIRFRVDGKNLSSSFPGAGSFCEFEYDFRGNETLTPDFRLAYESGERPPKTTMEVMRDDPFEFIIRVRKEDE